VSQRKTGITGNSGKSMGISQSGGSMGYNGGSMGYMMVVPDNGGSLYLLDDGFTSNGVGMRYKEPPLSGTTIM
jgi:hypothetical protein